MDLLKRNNVSVTGRGERALVFAHGFGCDRAAWREIIPAFEDRFRIVAFDHVGAGGSDLAAYASDRYASLHGYADDVLQILAALDLGQVVFIGHSVSCMIGLLAAIRSPERFAGLVMLCPSPCYVREPGYDGGFSRADLDELLEMIDSNFLGWSRATAPAIMGNPDRPELAETLGGSFCRTDPVIAREFARVTFLSDHRADLERCTVPALILQARGDMVAPEAVGAYMAARMPKADLVVMQATGHCPHMSAPGETIGLIETYLAGPR
ncbi:alpha/beta fold hydrolase [Caulobacter hibisci]|uniref:alpha/beta fold hydrolase n=1 Tax=Caulobacter hibisci TaxID=2035993 RepID=UPI001E53B141|nr:alpha/beta hydrolase [Caulobacter hibisci]